MARGAAQARRKPRPQPQTKRKKAAPTWEEQLFFSRLRRHAKVMYVLLALAFAVGFVLLGVGSGSTGIGDLLQGKLFGGGGGSSVGSQINDKQDAIKAHPQNVNLYLDLAGLYQGQQQDGKALATLQQARTIAPKNAEVLNRIGSIYSGRAAQAGNAYSALLTSYQENATAPPWLDTSSQLGQALVADPYTQALQSRLNEAYTKVTSQYQKAESFYRQAADAAKGTADEPNAILQWANSAQNANDASTAITAYERFLRVAPNNPNAPVVRQTLAQLKSSLGNTQR